jgi:ribosomal protein S18 acetylase RimI-like enzyme
MEFKKLAKKDKNLVFGLLREAALWLKEKNIDYWQNWLNPPQEHYRWVMKGLAAGQFYAVYINNSEAGMFRLQYQDEAFWGDMPDKAAYIHSFTVKRDFAGQNTGYEILGRIEADQKKAGIDFLRLDCGSHIEGLIHFYQRFGFRKVNIGNVDGYKLVFLEKPIN